MLRSIVIVIIFALAVGYITVLNPGSIIFKWSPAKEAEMPLMFLLYITFVLGVIVSLIAFVTRDTVKAYRDYSKKKAEEKKRKSEELYNEGVEEILKGDYRMAESKLKVALEKNPENIKVYFRLADIREKQNKKKDAVDILLKARSMWKDDLDLSFRLAEFYEKLKEYNNAIEILKKMLVLDEGNLKVLRMLRDLLWKDGKFESAYRVQKNIVKITRKSPGYYKERELMGQFKYGYATEILAQKDYDKAIRKLGDVIKQAPDFVPAYVTLGEIHLNNKNNPDKAGENWEDAYKRLGHPVFLIKLEEMYLRLEKPSEILDVYNRLVSSNSEDPILRFFFGKLCLRLEMLDAAMDHLSILESRGVLSSYLHLLMAEAEARKGDYYNSVKEFRKATDIVSRIVIPYICSSCGAESKEWNAYCKSCGSMNTLYIDIGFDKSTKSSETEII
ncbi:MAG TPA: hypothetical protein VII00_00365 [bacterium]